MALNIKDPETDALARRVAELSGQSITDAVKSSLESRLADLLRQADRESRRQFIDFVAQEARLELGDRPRPAMDEVFGYDENGLPT